MNRADASERLKWTETIARAVATVVVAWSLVALTDWRPIICGVVSAVFCVGTAFLSPRRWSMVWAAARLWAHRELGTPWRCLDAHCLTCCTCGQCHRDRGRALGLGIPITLRTDPGPRRAWDRWWYS